MNQRPGSLDDLASQWGNNGTATNQHPPASQASSGMSNGMRNTLVVPMTLLLVLVMGLIGVGGYKWKESRNFH